jgi:hypothetical protein
MTAMKARKYISCFAVSFFDMTANTAFSRGITRIDVAKRNARTLGLISDFELQVAKGPRMQDASMRPGSSYPRPNATEIFHGDSERGAFSLIDYFFADDVIDMLRKTTFLSATFAKQTLRAFGVLALKLAAESNGPSTHSIQFFARKILTIACSSNVGDANVHTEPTENLFLLGVRNVNRHEEEEIRVTQYKIGLASLVCEKRALVLSADKWNRLPARQGPEAHGVALPGQNARVIGNRAERTELLPRFFVELVSVGNLGGAADDHLGRKVWEGFARIAVDDFVESELPKDARIPRLGGNPITRRIGAPNRRGKRHGLLNSWLQFQLNDELHSYVVSRSRLEYKPGRDFLPPVFAPRAQ